MRELLYRPSWQALRVSFLKEHRDDGGWTTMEGTRSNLVKIIAYVHGVEPFYTCESESASMGYKVEHEYDARLYRAINCLNAVRMGYSGAGTSGSDPDYFVLDTRDKLQKMQTVNYHRYLTYASKRWDWRVVKTELRQMVDATPSDFQNIQKNLITRTKGKDMRNRPELETFLRIMEEVQLGD